MQKVTFVGHGTLMMAWGGKVIHVDPVSMYADYATLPKADLILVIRGGRGQGGAPQQPALGGQLQRRQPR